MASRGRAPLSRNVHALGELLVPDELLLDTSFVYEALQSGQKFHSDCVSFLERAANQGTVLFFNRLLEVELREVAFKGAFERRWGSGWRSHRYDGRTRGAAARQAEQVLDAWFSLLDANSHACVEVDEVHDLIDDFMKMGLGSYDAVHAATAAYADIHHVATLDASFALVPDLTIHIDASRVIRCRQTRGGRAK